MGVFSRGDRIIRRYLYIVVKIIMQGNLAEDDADLIKKMMQGNLAEVFNKYGVKVWTRWIGATYMKRRESLKLFWNLPTSGKREGGQEIIFPLI